MSESMGLSDTDKEVVQVAGMLHYVGHGPYSHTLDTYCTAAAAKTT